MIKRTFTKDTAQEFYHWLETNLPDIATLIDKFIDEECSICTLCGKFDSRELMDFDYESLEYYCHECVNAFYCDDNNLNEKVGSPLQNVRVDTDPQSTRCS